MRQHSIILLIIIGMTSCFLCVLYIAWKSIIQYAVLVNGMSRRIPYLSKSNLDNRWFLCMRQLVAVFSERMCQNKKRRYKYKHIFQFAAPYFYLSNMQKSYLSKGKIQIVWAILLDYPASKHPSRISNRTYDPVDSLPSWPCGFVFLSRSTCLVFFYFGVSSAA